VKDSIVDKRVRADRETSRTLMVPLYVPTVLLELGNVEQQHPHPKEVTSDNPGTRNIFISENILPHVCPACCAVLIHTSIELRIIVASRNKEFVRDLRGIKSPVSCQVL
jgi:hypothetical protein